MGANELVCFHQQRRDAAARDAGDNAHLEGVVEIRVGKGVTVEIRHLSGARRHPPDPGAEKETRRGRRPPARSRRRRRRRADPGTACGATQPAAPLSMPGAPGSGPAAPLLLAVPFLWIWIPRSGLWLRLNKGGGSRGQGTESGLFRPASLELDWNSASHLNQHQFV